MSVTRLSHFNDPDGDFRVPPQLDIRQSDIRFLQFIRNRASPKLYQTEEEAFCIRSQLIESGQSLHSQFLPLSE
jgi:hypothetical protein